MKLIYNCCRHCICFLFFQSTAKRMKCRGGHLSCVSIIPAADGCPTAWGSIDMFYGLG